MVARPHRSSLHRGPARRRQARHAVRRSRQPRVVPSGHLNPMYVELHCHSAFSFLDGASLPEQLVLEAQRLQYPALALTDHNGVYGSMAFAQAARQLGIQPITGAEVTLLDGTHLTLLAETPVGYASLCRLL